MITLAEDIIPHRGDMLLVDQVVEIDRQASTGRIVCDVKGSKPYWDQTSGEFIDLWLVEVMAQSVACVYSLAGESLREKLGYLIAIDTFEADISKVANVGDRIETDVKLLYHIAPVGGWECISRIGDRVVGQASFKALVDEGGERLNASL
jgi:predicted hotdog family 3-hydroxylacyl-ACP dehydratase